MYRGNCIGKNVLPGPQTYKLQLRLKFTPNDTMNGVSHSVLEDYLSVREDRRKQMQLTAGLIGLKTSFFSSGFLGALS